jgi:hypothetical protein
MWFAVGGVEASELPAIGDAEFDLRARAATASLEAEDIRVLVVRGDDWGGFRIEFSSAWVLEVVPTQVIPEEQWRTSEAGRSESHFVVFQNGDEPHA